MRIGLQICNRESLDHEQYTTSANFRNERISKKKKKRLFHLYKSELNNSYKKTFFIRAFYTLVLNSLVFSLVSSSRCLVGLV